MNAEAIRIYRERTTRSELRRHHASRHGRRRLHHGGGSENVPGCDSARLCFCLSCDRHHGHGRRFTGLFRGRLDHPGENPLFRRRPVALRADQRFGLHLGTAIVVAIFLIQKLRTKKALLAAQS